MFDVREASGFIGRTLYDANGDKIGRIDDVYLDDDTGRPEWFAVTTGLFGTKTSFVPIEGTSTGREELTTRWTKGQVKGAPRCEADGQLTPEEERTLYAHYGLPRMAAGVNPDTTGVTPLHSAPDMAGVATGDTHDAMTRSEEELHVDTHAHEVGRARLRKWVDTEYEQRTVPVARDRVHVEREPIDAEHADHAMRSPEIGEAVHEIPLFEEEVVVNTEVVPKERVRLEKDTTIEDETVGADVRKERVEIDEPDRRRH